MSTEGNVGTTTGGPLTVAGVPIYGIGDSGDLYWYFHQGALDGSALWANDGNRVKVGNGWNEGLNVFKGAPNGTDGVIYRVNSQGDLYWYKHLGAATGSQDWIEGKKVGNGWQDARIIFAAGGGLVYVIDKNGDLLWFRHLGYADGRSTWSNDGAGSKVGVGWGGVRIAFGAGDGVIYAADRQGDLYWYRHEGHMNGTFAWANGAAGAKVGNGWNQAGTAFSGGNGVIYAEKGADDLYWYGHTGFATGAGTWTPPGTGNLIGTGWSEMVRIF